ncbi:site-2 protease family protein [Geopsychrobacter electrodiphilus]|uniref:site-2 protease family protein n=1 Tax=Geopsychrobacter electrodiphilus TaxID=225196 RepID=UPI00036DCC5D|nr:site-2 protease family protein [Geopsychrobacter electrodiphilus]
MGHGIDAFLLKLSVMLVPALLAIILHEVAHGYVADRLGDPTARLLGRLTLNPLRHLDPIGTIAIFVFGFGWARPVPVNAKNLRHPRQDMIWVALAGPLTNLALALISVLFLRGISLLETTQLVSSQMFLDISRPLRVMAAFSLYINLLLGVFNLLPIPPLDGGRVLVGILPGKQALWLNRFEPFGFVLLLLLIFFTDVWSRLLSPLMTLLLQTLAGGEYHYVEKAISFLFGG